MKVKINGCTLARDNHALRNARKYRNASRNNERERHMYSASYMNLIDKELIKDRERRERGVGGGGARRDCHFVLFHHGTVACSMSVCGQQEETNIVLNKFDGNLSFENKTQSK